MSRPLRSFDPSELGSPDADVSAADLAQAAAIARDLEILGTDPGVRPPDDFEDRVMAAVALEAAPRLVARAGGSVRGGRAGAFLLTIRDAWAVGSSSGYPLTVRGQALALVLLAVLAAGALTGLTGLTVGGLFVRDTSPNPSLETPSIEPSPTPSPTPSPSPTEILAPSDAPRSSESAEPEKSRETSESGEPSGSPQGVDDATGGGGTPATRTPVPRRLTVSARTRR